MMDFHTAPSKPHINPLFGLVWGLRLFGVPWAVNWGYKLDVLSGTWDHCTAMPWSVGASCI